MIPPSFIEIMDDFFQPRNRRKEDINVTTERRTRVQPNLANQAFEDLCHVCFAAGECTCSDEQFYADRATFLSKEMK